MTAYATMEAAHNDCKFWETIEGIAINQGAQYRGELEFAQKMASLPGSCHGEWRGNVSYAAHQLHTAQAMVELARARKARAEAYAERFLAEMERESIAE